MKNSYESVAWWEADTKEKHFSIFPQFPEDLKGIDYFTSKHKLHQQDSLLVSKDCGSNLVN